MEKIPVSGPWITQKEVRYVTDAVRTAWFSNANTYNRMFEDAFADYLGVRHALCLPSCTAALHLALAALGIGPGDEVIVPDVTWIATAAPIDYVGAEPVFADIDARTWCLSVPSVESLISPRTKAIIAVDLYGGLPDMTSLRRVAEARRIHLIEDAAEAIGTEYRGQKAGSFGDIGVFSFHGSKTMTTGEGGMLATNSGDVYERVTFLRDHGRPPGDRYFQNTEVAYKYKMSSLQAALGVAQLERIDELISRKRQIFQWYHQRLGSDGRLTLNVEPEGVKNSYWMVTAIVDPGVGIEKYDLMDCMIDKGIDTRPFFSPLSGLPAYRHRPGATAAMKRNRTSYSVSRFGINLPSGFNVTAEAVNRIAAALVDCLDRTAGARHGR